jgi:hypothetical protein
MAAAPTAMMPAAKQAAMNTRMAFLLLTKSGPGGQNAAGN